MTHDPFRPARDPYRAIYDALAAEASSRKSRHGDDAAQCESEIEAVLASATEQARILHLRAPTRHEVEESRQAALGHLDFGLTWVCHVVRAMERPRASLPAPGDATRLYRQGWVRGNLHAIAGGALDADGPPAAHEEEWVGFIDALSAHRAAERPHA